MEPAIVAAAGGDTHWAWNLLLLLTVPALVALNGLFVAAEFALVAVRRTRVEQLVNGWRGICNYVAEELAVGDTAGRRRPLEELTGYVAKHVGRLDYAGQLAEGRPIGSGLVEGSIKTVGLRIKARGARWCVGNVDKMAGLCCLRHSTFWDAYWRSTN